MAEVSVPMAWYVLRAISGKEAKVKEYIDAEIKNGSLNGNVAQVLIPTEKVVQMRGNKRVVKERNYLPGYVLVEARLVGEIAHTLRNTPNVLGFLPDMNNPEPLREAEANRILGKVDEIEDDVKDMEVPYIVGDVVKVTDGPFAGFTGAIEKVDEEKKKVTVTVKVFGRSTGLDLGFINIMDFCKQFNARTQDKAGKVLPVVITYYTDKTFSFVIKTPPAAVQLLEAAKKKSGSAQPNRQKVASVTWDQVKAIAEDKMPDLNCFTIESAMRLIAGTARSMGITVSGEFPESK